MCLVQKGQTPLMIPSYEGHSDIVQTLIEAKALVNTQEEVYVPTIRKHAHHITTHRVSLYTAVLDEVTVCACVPHRMAGLLFTWQL